MDLKRRIRAVAAVVAGLVITTTVGLSTLVLSIVYRLLIDWWAWWKNPLEKAPKYWSWIMDEFCTRWLLGINVKIEGTIPLIKKEEIVVCIANHPSTIALSVFIRFLTQAITDRLVAIAKSAHLWNPAIGLALRLIRGGIFINRDTPEAAFASIRRGVRRLPKPPFTFFILPDQHRHRPASIEKDRAQFAGRIPDLDTLLEELLVPRHGGLLEMLKGLDRLEKPFRVINVTVALSVRDQGVKDAIAVQGSTLHIHIEELDPAQLPRAKKDMEKILTALWWEKYWRIKNWRSFE